MPNTSNMPNTANTTDSLQKNGNNNVGARSKTANERKNSDLPQESNASSQFERNEYSGDDLMDDTAQKAFVDNNLATRQNSDDKPMGLNGADDKNGDSNSQSKENTKSEEKSLEDSDNSNTHPNEAMSKSDAAFAAIGAAKNMKSASEEAVAQDTEENLKDVAKETAKALPKVAVDVGSGNVPGAVADAADYASRTLVKIAKVVPVLFLVLILLIASVFSMVGMLPSLIFGGLDEKLEERQANKVQKVITEAYEDRASYIVSDIIKQTKTDAEIGTFSAWKRIVAGKNDDYSIDVRRANEADAVIILNNKKTSTGLKITFENIYMTDYEALKVDKVALVNAYAYESSYGDDDKFKAGNAVDTNELFNTDSSKKWRSSDTSGLKSWLKDNSDSLVTYSVEETGTVVEDGYTYRQLTYRIDGVFTEEQIYTLHNFTDAQKEQLRAMNFAGNMYIAACDDTSPDGTEELSFNIYPKLDVYTNLVGGNDNLIWSVLPKDYMHLIADNDEGGTASLIREYLTSAKSQVGYVAGDNNSSVYGQWNNTDCTNWNATMLAWCADDVDKKLSMDTKMLGDVIPNTNSVDYMTGYLFNNNYVWHYSSDNYVPQSGDIIVVYSPEQSIAEDGRVTVTDKAAVAENCPELGVTDTELRVSALGLVESSSGGTVSFICGDTSNHSAELINLDMSDEKIVAYVTPDYEKVVSTDGVLTYDGEVLDKGQFLFPVKGTVTVSALYPLYPSGTPHSGLDLACPVNTPVIAANTGTVVTVDNLCTTTYGKYIKIKSDTPSGVVYCIYAHLNQICVKEGDTVSAGTVIALSGNTGNTTGPHLHFGVKNSIGVNVNPINFLARRDEVRLHATISN